MKLNTFALPLVVARASRIVPNGGSEALQEAILGNHGAAPASSCSFERYTALGDSFAVGLGSQQRLRLCNTNEDADSSTVCTTADCGKDTGSYAWQFSSKHKLDSDFRYIGCSGAPSTDILKQVNNAKAFGTPDLITVNAGGDDSSAFGSVARACMFDFGSYNSTVCDQQITAANDTIFLELPRNLNNLFSAIRTKAPSATVVVMSYIKFWANVDAPNCAWPLNEASPDFKRRMNALVDGTNALLQKVANKWHFEFANADPIFEGHRVCSQLGKDSFKSWFQMFPKAGDDTSGAFYSELSLAHPTFDGQQAYLAALEAKLNCPDV